MYNINKANQLTLSTKKSAPEDKSFDHFDLVEFHSDMVCKSTSLRYLQSYQLYRANSLAAKRWSETCFEPGRMFPYGSMYGIFTNIYHKQSTKCRCIYHTWILWVWILGKNGIMFTKNQPLNGVVDEYKLRLQSKGHIGHIGHVAGYHTRGICRKIQFLFRNFCEKIT